MRYRGDEQSDETTPNPGAPGTEDAYARGAGATDGTADGSVDEVAGADGSADAVKDAGVVEDTGVVEVNGVAADPLQHQLDEQRDKYLRLAAEFDNFRRRSARERAEAAARGQADLVKQLIDALDDLSRFAHIDPETTDTVTVVQGVEMVEKKLLKTLGAAGLEVVNPLDQPFDPALHEAVSTEPALSSEDDHMIARVYQQGYVFSGQLLRPARVVVKQWNG